jgi:hypothetical protein
MPHNSPSRTRFTTKLTTLFGLSSEQIAAVQTQYENEFIQEKIAMIADQSRFKKVRSKIELFLSAIKHNYQPAKGADTIVDIQHAKLEFEQVALRREVESIRAEYLKLPKKTIQASIEVIDAR